MIGVSVLTLLLLVPPAQGRTTSSSVLPNRASSLTAYPHGPADVRVSPGGRHIATLPPHSDYAYQRLALLVLAEARTPDGTRWLRVRLPARHGAPSGWINASKATTRVNPWRIEISNASGTMRLLRRGKVVRSAKVVVGSAQTPTPRGLHALHDRWSPEEDFYAGWILSLTTVSPQVPTLGGVPAVVAIHGWNGAERGAGSLGCVRVADVAMGRVLVRNVPAGTPVLVS